MYVNSRLAVHSRRRFVALGAASFGLGALAPLTAWSQAFPDRPITVLVPSVAGGGTDGIARAFGAELTRRLKQTVIVENLPGASGLIATAKLVKAPADGYTLLVGNSDVVLNPLVHKSAGYRLDDLTPIASLGGAPLCLVARSGFAASNVEQLIAIAKAKPRSVTVGVSGVSLPSVGVAMLEQAAGMELLPIPYKGASQVMTDLLGGQVDLAVTALINVLPHVRNGRLKMLGLLSHQRAAVAPDLPLVTETAATRTVSLDIWAALFGPAKMPAAVVSALNAAAQDIWRDPAYREMRLQAGDIVAQPAPQQEVARFMAAESTRYRAVAAKLKVE
jgi:tripartite-type tricarboxylate transporter receptor subunit TctC